MNNNILKNPWILVKNFKILIKKIMNFDTLKYIHFFFFFNVLKLFIIKIAIFYAEMKNNSGNG